MDGVWEMVVWRQKEDTKDYLDAITADSEQIVGVCVDTVLPSMYTRFISAFIEPVLGGEQIS